MDFNRYFQVKLPEQSDFKPEFCPHPKCSKRGQVPSLKNWCKKSGSFTRHDGSGVMRWTCRQGKKRHTFSYASFEATYWLKRRDLLEKIAQNSTEQSSLRGLARTLGVSQNCIYGQTMRIGRHSLLLHHMALKAIEPEKLGTMVFDELESWEVSQFTPTSHPLLMDFESGFKLHLLCIPINRKGKLTVEQKEKYQLWVEKHGKNPTQNANQFLSEILKYLKPIYQNKSKFAVVTDKKKSYPKALENSWKGLDFTHFQYSGKTERKNPWMGKINQEDQYIRQRCATMRRESLDFMRRNNNTSLRHSIYLIKRNMVMPQANTSRKKTPAVRLGLLDQPISWQSVMQKRIFPFWACLPPFLERIYKQLNRSLFFAKNQSFQSSFV